MKMKFISAAKLAQELSVSHQSIMYHVRKGKLNRAGTHSGIIVVDALYREFRERMSKTRRRGPAKDREKVCA
ncbi:MAG: hypothetical protein HGA87_00770 [Desulfobulbaceae bacterium]|nr:hypothetical protein [Desulfobulbaceae bacterium]